MMIPDCLKKLKDAHGKLTGLLGECQELHETAECVAAKEQLELVQGIICT